MFGTAHSLNDNHKISLKHDGVEIEQVIMYKYLGVKLDEKLTFTNHIEDLKFLESCVY